MYEDEVDRCDDDLCPECFAKCLRCDLIWDREDSLCCLYRCTCGYLGILLVDDWFDPPINLPKFES